MQIHIANARKRLHIPSLGKFSRDFFEKQISAKILNPQIPRDHPRDVVRDQQHQSEILPYGAYDELYKSNPKLLV
jgi:hypothetical protein